MFLQAEIASEWQVAVRFNSLRIQSGRPATHKFAAPSESPAGFHFSCSNERH